MAAAIKTKTGGDDLDDQFDLDPDLIASGSELGDEDDGEGEAGSAGDPDVEGSGSRPVLEDEDEVGQGDRRLNEGVKRKAGLVEEDIGEDGRSRTIDREEKKRRKKDKEKERKAKVSRLRFSSSSVVAVTVIPQLQAGRGAISALYPCPKVLDSIAEHQRALRDATDPTISSIPPTHLPTETLLALLRTSLLASQPALTPMEIADRLPPLNSILPPPEHAPPNLPTTSFDPLRRRVAGLLKKGKLVRGKPRIIILCLSGLRCADVARELREVKGEGQVAKVSISVFAVFGVRKPDADSCSQSI